MTARLTAEQVAEIRARAEVALSNGFGNRVQFCERDVPALCDEVAALAKERDEARADSDEFEKAWQRLALEEERRCAELARVTAERDAWQARANETAASLQQFVDEMGAKLATAEADNARLREALAAIENLTWDPNARGLGETLPRDITPTCNRILRQILAHFAKEPTR